MNVLLVRCPRCQKGKLEVKEDNGIALLVVCDQEDCKEKFKILKVNSLVGNVEYLPWVTGG